MSHPQLGASGRACSADAAFCPECPGDGFMKGTLSSDHHLVPAKAVLEKSAK